MIFINVRHKVVDLISGIKNWGIVLIRRKPNFHTWEGQTVLKVFTFN